MQPIVYDWNSFGEGELARYGDPPDTEFQEFIAAHPITERMDFADVPAARDAMKVFDQKNLKLLGPPPLHVEEFRKSILLRDGHKTPAWIIRRTPSVEFTERRPLIVLFHGGGFTLGTESHMVPYARGLSSLFNAVVVSATYRLAPEHPFPIGPLDAYDALQWTASRAKELGADPSCGFIIGGISAGGNLACVLTQLSRDRGLSPPLTGQWSCVPLLEPLDKSKWFSREQNADAELLSTRDQHTLDTYYAANLKSSLYSPLNSESGLKGSPKSYIQVCGADPLRDDGLILAKALLEAGVPTKIDLYPGLPHGFWAFFPQLSTSKRFMIDLAQAFGWLLRVTVDTKHVGEVLLIPSQ